MCRKGTTRHSLTLLKVQFETPCDTLNNVEIVAVVESPTEILAYPHGETFSDSLSDMEVKALIHTLVDNISETDAETHNITLADLKV